MFVQKRHHIMFSPNSDSDTDTIHFSESSRNQNPVRDSLGVAAIVRRIMFAWPSTEMYASEALGVDVTICFTPLWRPLVVFVVIAQSRRLAIPVNSQLRLRLSLLVKIKLYKLSSKQGDSRQTNVRSQSQVAEVE